MIFGHMKYSELRKPEGYILTGSISVFSGLNILILIYTVDLRGC